MYVDFDGAGQGGAVGFKEVSGAPAAIPVRHININGLCRDMLRPEEDNYQKLEGEYLLATSTMARLESEDGGKTEKVEVV